MSKLDFAGMRAFCSFYEKKLKANEELSKLPQGDGAALHLHYMRNDMMYLQIVGSESVAGLFGDFTRIKVSLEDEDAKYLYDKYIKLLEENNQRKQDLFLGENI